MDHPITVGREDLPKLKSSVSKALPHMGHARTVEVLAAALGFKSHAALRSATASGAIECQPREHANAVARKLERFKDADPSKSAASVARLMENLAHWERAARGAAGAVLLMANGHVETPEGLYATLRMRKAIRDDGQTPEDVAKEVAAALRDFGHDVDEGFRKLDEAIEADRIRFEREDLAARTAG